MATAVVLWSPVIITVLMPADFASATACLTSFRGDQSSPSNQQRSTLLRDLNAVLRLQTPSADDKQSQNPQRAFREFFILMLQLMFDFLSQWNDFVIDKNLCTSSDHNIRSPFVKRVVPNQWYAMWTSISDRNQKAILVIAGIVDESHDTVDSIFL